MRECDLVTDGRDACEGAYYSAVIEILHLFNMPVKVNDGSHSIHNDLYVSYGEQTNASYLDVFKEIFNKSGQQGHYNMMMGIENNHEENVVTTA